MKLERILSLIIAMLATAHLMVAFLWKSSSGLHETLTNRHRFAHDGLRFLLVYKNPSSKTTDISREAQNKWQISL
jgi:hypothetical protein